MGKLLLAYDNTIDECTLSGGSWTTGLPLSYLQTRQIDQKARSSSASTRDTWCYIAAPSAITVAALAVIGGNFTTGATLRLRGFSADPRGLTWAEFNRSAALPGGFTFSRGSVGWYMGASGVLVSAANNIPRFEYSNGVLQGLLLEPTTTNSFSNARDFGTINWTRSNCTSTKNQTGLDGSANGACSLAFTGSPGTLLAGIGGLTGQTVTVSIWAKTSAGTAALGISPDNTNWTTVTVTTTWQRFQATGVAGANCGFRGTGINVIADFAQVEIGAAATSNIETTGAAATRQPDILTGAVASFAAGGLLLEGKLIARPASSTQPFAFVATTNTGDTGIGLDMTTGGVMRGFNHNAGINSATGVNSAAYANGATFAAAIGWDGTTLRASYEGAAAVVDAAVTTLAGTANTYVRGGPAFHLTGLRIYSYAPTTADLVSLSGAEREIVAQYDSGTYDAWPAAYVAATTERMRRGEQTPALHRPATPQSYRYWRLDVDDTTNPDGWVEFGRPVLAWNAFQSEHDVACGLGIYFKPRSTTVTTASGARYFDELPAPKCLDFTFHYLADAEAWDTIYELMRTQGATGEVLVSLDPDDARNLPRHTFLATVADMEKLRAMAKGYWTKAFTAEQLL
ncbi:MAG TPA: hypothetical protein VEC57_14490 [Candidatus Limnocylindrales bacterium]|nr:hypothetical protein [Candidatus Limnocylindrales bacterium]